MAAKTGEIRSRGQECVGENFNLRDLLLKGRTCGFHERIKFFSDYVHMLDDRHQSFYMRPVLTPSDREVIVHDPVTGRCKTMLMFGSNNYLGLANHPVVAEKVRNAIERFGVGIGGPPLLNGTTSLHRELEERLSVFKHTEDTVLFSSGYAANVGLVTALTGRNDVVLYDELSHASFTDGLRMSDAKSVLFGHNDVLKLDELLFKYGASKDGDRFVGVEGVYSMDGDLAPLNHLIPLCRKHGAILIVDDAHGTGVLGRTGSGIAEHFGMEGKVDIVMGTFSKSFGVVGGFVSASKPIADYLRFMARSHMFSASLPPIVVAAVLAGLDVMAAEPERLWKLRSNVQYANLEFRKRGFDVNTPTPIIALRVPEWMNIREAAFRFHESGIFVNAVEYPAVPVRQQRFRISLTADHTKNDIDRLVECAETVWAACAEKVDDTEPAAAG
jgi:glycine C-acetyltransferase